MHDRNRGNRTLAEVLAALHEHFSATARLDRRAKLFRIGHDAGMRFARICVLDTLASEAAHIGACEHNARPHRRREQASVQSIQARLTSELDTATTGDPEYDAGYRTGVQLALRYLALARSALDLDEAASDTKPDPQISCPATTIC